MTSPARDPEHLKLHAFDQDDLAVLSAHLQDAVVRIGDLAYLPAEGRFALLARRFDWPAADVSPRRLLAGLHFERVSRCRTRGIDREQPDGALNLLALTFQESEAPGGTATLVFAGGATVELEVECIEAQLKDLGPVWAASRCPAHDLEPT